MDNSYDQIILMVGQESLFRRGLSLEEVIEIIAQYPTSLWLDLFSKIEGFLVIPREKDFDSQLFLSENLFPPSVLSRTKRKSADVLVYFSLGQINLLRKLAILYGNDGDRYEIPKVELSKALLAATDLHNQYDTFQFKKAESLGKKADLETFASFIVRNGYLNSTTDLSSLLARTHGIYIEQAKKIPLYPNVTFDQFFAKQIGISLDEAIALLVGLVVQFYQDKRTSFDQTTIIDLKNHFEKTTVDPKKINSIIETLVVDLSVVKEQVSKELDNLDPDNTPVGYDLAVFRKYPLVRLEGGKLVCVNLSCLLQKITQNVIWMLMENLGGSERAKLINDLTEYRGRVFEEYIKELCSLFERKNKKISFLYIPPESTSDSEEVGDSILIQGDRLVIFEAKSRQFNESFKNTGDWDKDKKFIDELIVKAAHQIEIASEKIRNGKVKIPQLDIKNIKQIYPVVVSYESVPMHGKMQRFVRQKIKEAGYLVDPVYAPFEIMTLDDLQRLVDVSDTVTLVDLLQRKAEGDPHANETNFNNFFSNFLLTNKLVSNGWQKQIQDVILESMVIKNLNFKELQK